LRRPDKDGASAAVTASAFRKHEPSSSGRIADHIYTRKLLLDRARGRELDWNRCW